MLTLSGQLIWIPFIVFFLFHSYKSDGKKGAFFFLLFLSLVLSASDATSSYIIKNYFNRLRPCKETELIALIHSFGQKCGGRFGFVSSHASNSFALVFFSVRAIKFKNHLKYYMWIMPTIVAYSRIYLGVHYPGDIIGGIVVGIFWGFIFSQLFKLSYYGANR
jgi:undecaprenyl-diphosphatase